MMGSINKDAIDDYEDELYLSLDEELALAENMLDDIQTKIDGMGQFSPSPKKTLWINPIKDNYP